jgi:hypothetical protein
MRVKAFEGKEHEKIPPLNAAGPAQRAQPYPGAWNFGL